MGDFIYEGNRKYHRLYLLALARLVYHVLSYITFESRLLCSFEGSLMVLLSKVTSKLRVRSLFTFVC